MERIFLRGIKIRYGNILGSPDFLKVVNVDDVVEFLDITKISERDLLKEMIRVGILTEVTGFKRNRVFSFKEYLKLF